MSAAPTAAFTGLGYERLLGGSVTLNTREKVRWPPRLVAVTSKIVGPLTLVGLPEMTPVELSSDKPGGNSGLTAYRSIGPETAGVNAMASPTTAGKGSDPLYDKSGGGRDTGSPSPQATSAHKVMNAPMSRIGLAQFRLEPVKHRFPEHLIQARQFGEQSHMAGPSQLRTQCHGYAVEPAAETAAEVLGFRQIEALTAVVPGPGSEPERTSAVIAADVFALLDSTAHKPCCKATLTPHV